jgi:hypothetical protein
MLFPYLTLAEDALGFPHIMAGFFLALSLCVCVWVYVSIYGKFVQACCDNTIIPQL